MYYAVTIVTLMCFGHLYISHCVIKKYVPLTRIFILSTLARRREPKSADLLIKIWRRSRFYTSKYVSKRQKYSLCRIIMKNILSSSLLRGLQFCEPTNGRMSPGPDVKKKLLPRNTAEHLTQLWEGVHKPLHTRCVCDDARRRQGDRVRESKYPRYPENVFFRSDSPCVGAQGTVLMFSNAPYPTGMKSLYVHGNSFTPRVLYSKHRKQGKK